ncbi:MAG: hypothetical protein ABIE07_09630 [Candidatus Zixiibacteriota bacterium]
MKNKFTCGLLLTLTIIAFVFNSLSFAIEKPINQNPVDISKSSENLVMNWPESGEWKSGLKKAYGQSVIEFFYPKGQTQGNWTEMGSIEINPVLKEVPIITTARSIFLGTEKASPKATWDILERGKTENGYPFIIFEIICPEFRTKEEPQIQYWKIIDGNLNSHTVQYSFRGTTIPEEKKKEILDALKDAKLTAAKKI